MTWNAIGHVVTGGTTNAARFRQSSTQNFTSGTVADVNLQTTVFNNAPLTKTSTYFQTTSPGYWDISGQFVLAWNSSATERRAAIRTLKSSNYLDLAVMAANCTNGLINLSTGLVWIDTGTTIAMRGAQWSGATIATIADTSGTNSEPGQHSWLSFRYLGQ